MEKSQFRMEKISVDFFFLNQNTSEKKKWMEITILKILCRYCFQEKINTLLNNIWMEKIICGVCFSTKNASEKNEWRNLQISILDG